jgi:NADH-quinone oxidoreductase subunit J
MRVILLLVLGLVVGITSAVVAPGVAVAQPAAQPSAGQQPPGPIRVQRPTQVRIKDRSEISRITPHGDRYEAQPGPKQPGLALMFWLFAAVTIGGALFAITRKNLIAAVMGMVGSFLGIAAVYMMLYAGFLSVIQILVYAGAIMVLFVFVIMILNRPEDEPVAPTGRVGVAVAGVAIAYLIGRLVLILVRVKPPTPNAGNAPAPVSLPPVGVNQPGEQVDWGSVKAVGSDLFTQGLFPFEAISILLLVAVVGAIAIVRPLKGEEADGGGSPTGSAGRGAEAQGSIEGEERQTV